MKSGGIEQLWKVATAFSRSTIVPKDYQNKPDNCLVALEMASSVGASALTVMQNLYIVHGKPSWSSQYIIAQINNCGRFTQLKWKVTPTGRNLKGTGSFKGDLEDVEFIAYATEISSGELVESPMVSYKMAILEGWYAKTGSKWQTMPDIMGRYRAASFFGKLYCPEVLNGLQSGEEIQDVEYSILPDEEESRETVAKEANTELFDPDRDDSEAPAEEAHQEETPEEKPENENQADGTNPKLDF